MKNKKNSVYATFFEQNQLLLDKKKQIMIGFCLFWKKLWKKKK